MVSEAVGHRDGRIQRATQRITHFQIALATGLLTDVAPGWNRILDEWVVHPFSHFVGHDGYVGNRAHQDGARIEIRRGVGLQTDRAVESQNAASGIGSKRGAAGTFALHNVVERKDREGGRINALRSESRKDRREVSSKDGEIDNRFGAGRTSAENGTGVSHAAGCGYVDNDSLESADGIENHVVPNVIGAIAFSVTVIAVSCHELEKFRALEGVNVLGGAHVGSAKIEIGGLNDGRLLNQCEWDVIGSRQSGIGDGRIELRDAGGSKDIAVDIDAGKN